MRNSKYTKNILEAAVANSICMADVLRALHLKITGGNFSHISSRIKFYTISTAHFSPRLKSILPVPPKRLKETVLILRTEGGRQKGKLLTRCLLESGIPLACRKCGQGNVWQGEPLTLEVNHRNNNFLDDRLENLEFLCPSCHSQYGRKILPKAVGQVRKKSPVLCVDCSKQISHNRTRCKSCATRLQPNKGNWVPEEEIITRLGYQSYEAVARSLGVSSNAIRKRLRTRGFILPKPIRMLK